MSLPSLTNHIDTALRGLRQHGPHRLLAGLKRGAHPTAQGHRDGIGMTLTPLEYSRRATLRAKALRAQASQRARPSVPISNRRVQPEAATALMEFADMASFATAMNLGKSQVARNIRQNLNGRGPGAVGGGRGGNRLGGAAARLLGYDGALRALDAAEEDAIAMQLPIGKVGDRARDLQQYFIDAEDAHAMERLLDPLFQENPAARLRGQALFDELKLLRHDEKQLMRWLAARQGLPPMGNARDARRRITEDRANYHASRDGKAARAAAHAREAGAETTDPSSFAEAYVEFLEQPDEINYLQQLLWLLPKEQQLGDLEHMLGQLKQAVGRDLTEADPSNNIGLLHRKAADLGELHLCSTLLSMTATLKSQLDRTVLRDQPLALSANLMLQHLLELVAKPARDAMSYLHYAQQLGVTDLKASIALLRGIGELVRQMHVKCFPSNEVHLEIRDAIAHALEQLIVEEEDLEAEAAAARDAQVGTAPAQVH